MSDAIQKRYARLGDKSTFVAIDSGALYYEPLADKPYESHLRPPNTSSFLPTFSNFEHPQRTQAPCLKS
jgi:hypothetical protein